MNPNCNPLKFSRRIQNRNKQCGLFPNMDKGNRQGGSLLTQPRPSGRFRVIGELESSVTRLQIAKNGIGKIRDELKSLRAFLEKEVVFLPRSNIPESVINHFLKERLSKIKVVSDTVNFQRKALLNGNSGVKGTAVGKGLNFVRGSARVVSSSETGYPVAICRAPSSSMLLGREPLTSQTIRNERLIAISAESQKIHYRIKREEDGESLVANLQECISDHGLDIGVYKTCGNCLLLKHNQLGDGKTFQGMSQKTGLVSKFPGKYKPSTRGENVSGTIASEPAHGYGGFLIGKEGNSRTDGLVLHYSGSEANPKVPVGSVRVKQNGDIVRLDLTGSKAEMLSLPGLSPDLLSVGVGNRSGFINLNSIRVNSKEERHDTLKLIDYSESELDSLTAELKRKEEDYISLAISLLQSGMEPKTAEIDLFSYSKEKAGEMAHQLKTAITPTMVQSMLY